MSIDLRLRTALLLAIVSALSACSAMDSGSKSQPSKPTVSAPKSPTTASPAVSSHGNKPTLALSTAQGRSGEVVNVSATLAGGSASIAGTQNDMGFDSKQLAIVATAKGKPDCAANRSLGKEGTAFSFMPPGCNGGPTCTGVRALVLSLSNTAPIPNGSTLYTCKVHIASGAGPGTYKLTNSRVGFSSPKGDAIDGAGGDGVVTVAK
jgi:hypothetical protein